MHERESERVAGSRQRASDDDATAEADVSRRTVLKAGALGAFAAFFGARALPSDVLGGSGEYDGEGPGPVGDSDQPPTDPDGDGLYEDVNGNGRMDVADSRLLFQNKDDVDPQYFDFNGNDRMDVADSNELFQEVSDGPG